MEAVAVPEVVHEGPADGAAADTMTYPTEVREEHFSTHPPPPHSKFL